MTKTKFSLVTLSLLICVAAFGAVTTFDSFDPTYFQSNNFKITLRANAVGTGSTNIPNATSTNNGIMTSNAFNQVDMEGDWSASAWPRPPFVINTWGSNGTNVTEAAVTNIAWLILTNGLLQYIPRPIIVIDEGWLTASGRDGSGNLIGDTTKFPHGLKWLSELLNSQGMGFGLYYGLGTNTENVGFLGGQASSNTFGYLIQDALNMATNLNLEYIKLNGVAGVSHDRSDECEKLFVTTVLRTGRKPYFWLLYADDGANGALPFVHKYGSDFRSFHLEDGNDGPSDVTDPTGWKIYLANFDVALNASRTRSIGHYVSMEGTGTDPGSSQGDRVAAMFAILGSQVILPTFFNQMGAFTNQDVLDIIFDQGGYQPQVLWTNLVSGVTNKIIGRKMANGDVALALLNRTSTAQSFSLTNLPIGPVVALYDCMARSYVPNMTNSASISVGGTNIYLYRAKRGIAQPFATPGKYYLSDRNWMLGSTNDNIGFPIQKDIDPAGSPIVVGGQSFSKGLGINADGFVQYFLGGQVSSFRGVAGMADAVSGAGGQVKFRFSADGVVLADTGTMVASAFPSTNINIDLTGRQVFTIEVLHMTSTSGGAKNRSAIGDAYFTVPQPAATPIYVWMPLSAIATEGNVFAYSAGTPSPTLWDGLGLRVNLAAGTRFHSGLPCFRDRPTCVSKFTVQATNVAGIAFTNLLYTDMGADITGTRHFTQNNVPTFLTNGVNYMFITNTWNNPNDTARWLYLTLGGISASNTTANIFFLSWEATFQ